MIGRIIAFVGGLILIGSGSEVLGDQSCDSVSFSGTRRASTVTCFEGQGGALPADFAGSVILLAGLGLLTFSVWPLIRGVFSFGRSLKLGQNGGLKDRVLSAYLAVPQVADTMSIAGFLAANEDLDDARQNASDSKAPGAGVDPLENRLRRLQGFYLQGLISEIELSERRREILKEI